MKTVKEIAETANVSKTSIYNLIKKHRIPTFKRNGKTFLDKNGESLVIGYYSTEQHETITGILTTTKSETENETSQPDFQDDIQDSKLIEYTKVINVLEDERSEKNKIIKELIQSNKILSQALTADKVNKTARLMLRDSMYSVNGNTKKPTKPRGFFSRIFRKK